MKFIVGIDEAGRGPLAGPVAVGAVLVRNDQDSRLPAPDDAGYGGQAIFNLTKEFPKLRDSKKLSEKKREEFFEKMKALKREGKLDFAVALVSAKLIDDRGISYAIKSGLEGCLKKLAVVADECEVLLDGGLKAPSQFLNQKTIIKGDETEPLISLASIAAKVTRDRYMIKVALEYPGYGFEVHKGYGTAAHGKAILGKGFSPIHRRSFCGRYLQKTGH